MRKTAHVFGIVTLESRPWFLHQFAPVFNGNTFLDFLKEIMLPLTDERVSPSSTAP